MDGGDYCLDCRRVTEVAYDHASGDTVCTECGLVLESRVIDETAEWRTFANDNDGTDKDPVRVGAPSNPLIEGQLLETVVARNKERREFPKVSRAAGRSNAQASLPLAFTRIDDICERLGVSKIVKDLACQIYAKLHRSKIDKRRDNNVVAAACVHIASQKENQSRTLKEMCMAANGVTEKKIVSAKNSIMKLLKEKDGPMELGTEQANDYLKRFAYNLGLNIHAIKAAQEIFKKSQEHDIRRTPKSVAVGIIYVTCQLCGHKRSAKDISLIANTSEGTIKGAYKDLYPYLPLIVPGWFATQNDLKKLYVP